MEITAPDAQALQPLVGQFVTVTFSSGAVVGAGGFTRLGAVTGSQVTLTTKGIPRTVPIKAIDRVGVLTIVPRQGRRF